MAGYCKECANESLFNICETCFNKYSSSPDISLSFAFDQNLKELSIPENTEILDLCGTGFTKIDWKNHDKLRILRLSNCENLESISLLNFRGLRCLDLSNCPKLNKISLESTYNIRTIDLSNCKSLKKFDCDMLGAEYMSFYNTQIDDLGYYPMIKYLDISNTKIKDLSMISSFTMLQVLRINNLPIDKIDLGPFTYLEDLAAIESNIADVAFTNICPTTSLISLYLKDCKNVSKIPKIRNFNAITPNGTYGRHFKVSNSSGDWVLAYRLLFGPFASKNEKSEKPEIKAVEHPEFDGEIIANQISGLLYGTAFGDILGKSINGKTREQIQFSLEIPLDVTWSKPFSDDQSPKFAPSDEYQKLLGNISKLVLSQDISEITDVSEVYMLAILSASLHFWEDNNKYLEKIIENQPKEVQQTATLASLLTSKLLQQRANIINKIDILQVANSIDFDTNIAITKISQLKNIKKELIPITAAVWVLRKGLSFEEGLSTVLRRSYETRLVGILVGGLLGARWGYCSIPMDLYHFMWAKGSVENALEFIYQKLDIHAHVFKFNQLPGIQWNPEEDQVSDPFAYQRIE